MHSWTNTSTADMASPTVSILGIKRYPALAGADRVVESILNHLTDSVHPLIYVRKDPAVAYQCSNVRSFVVIPTLGGKYFGPFLYFFLCAIHFLIKGQTKIVHVHNSDFGFFVPILRLRPGVKVIGTLHGKPYERDKWNAAARLFLRLSEWIFVRSCHVVTSVAPIELPSKQYHYIPNGVDKEIEINTSASSLLESYSLREKEFILFAAGRLDRTKGLHFLLRAISRSGLKKDLLVVSDFSHDEAYTNEVRILAKSVPHVTLHETLVSKAQLAYLLNASHVFVFPSEVEAMSMVLLEAIASKTVIVASDIPENEAVLGKDYPLLFRSGDVDDLSRILKLALDGNYDSLVNNQYVSTLKRFGWNQIVRQYESLYTI